ncbi:ribonuclease kappa-like [Choristoneura fumiferana]|uniref:ribonuclease kappa-like n=1 Tax=Choristoneura fumiferana TaxID=7141 RepID=UPI003D15B6B4
MLQGCAICCLLLSGWGVLQLLIMGILFKMESVLLIEDAYAHEYEDFTDFLKKTKSNYKALATNCFIAAGIYVVIMAICGLCLRKALRDARIQEANLLDDNISCRVEEKELSEKAKKKIK